MGGWDFRSALRALAACVTLLAAGFLGGCSGGMSLPLPNLAALSANATETEAEAQPQAAAEQRADAAELAKAGPLGDKTLGKKKAPVTIVEYASLTCPYCAKFHAETFPKLKKAYIDKGKVQYIYREFPIGRSAAAAAIAVRCAPEKAHFKLISRFYTEREKWVAQDVKHDEIYKIVQTAGLKRDKYDACFANQSINDALFEVKKRGRGLGVAGTPTFFVNGKKASGALSFEELVKLIDEAQTPPQPQQQAQVQAKPA